MKKILLLLLTIATFALQLNAAKIVIRMNVVLGDKIDDKPHRAPMLLPIEVSYDDETNQVEVIGDYDKPVEIFVCDEDLDVVAYSSVLNTVLDIPAGYHGLIVVRITSDNWVAVGKTEI